MQITNKHSTRGNHEFQVIYQHVPLSCHPDSSVPYRQKNALSARQSVHLCRLTLSWRRRRCCAGSCPCPRGVPGDCLRPAGPPLSYPSSPLTSRCCRPASPRPCLPGGTQDGRQGQRQRRAPGRDSGTRRAGHSAVTVQVLLLCVSDRSMMMINMTMSYIKTLPK